MSAPGMITPKQTAFLRLHAYAVAPYYWEWLGHHDPRQCDQLYAKRNGLPGELHEAAICRDDLQNLHARGLMGECFVVTELGRATLRDLGFPS